MEEQRPNSVEPIPNADWEKMPASAKRLVEELTFRVTQLEEQIERYKPRKNYCERKQSDIGKLIPTTITRLRKDSSRVARTKAARNEGTSRT